MSKVTTYVCSIVVFSILCITVTETLRDFPAEVALAEIPESLHTTQCPVEEERQVARHILKQKNQEIVQEFATIVSNCGPGLWRRVFYLNTSTSDQEISTCPNGWQRITVSSIRACRGAFSSCSSTFTNDITREYSKVCGRFTGMGRNTPDAFHRDRRRTLENNYVDGVSITHGLSGSRQHIWTLAAGHSSRSFGFARCPCDNRNRQQAPLPPNRVGNSYFCSRPGNRIWRGRGCTGGNPCCTFHDPPYFSVQLPVSTTDRIELRICVNQNRDDEIIAVHFAELYVQ